MIVVQGFIDWEKFKNDHLEVPKEFSMFDGYLFVEDINPMCSKDESLFLRICFSKNPTRRFGKPDVFPTSDGTLFQFIVEDRLLSTSNCVISKTFGRCTSKPMSIVFKLQQKRESSSETSPTTSHAPWTLLGMIFALFIFAFLISICIFLYYKSRNRENVEETDIHVKDHQLKNSLPKQELHLDFDFIDDSITFDI
ncbi:hypothetical protein GCK72_014515 [Caenorhabditis remanei]|uniref:Uncharacterized protein n=1 Tax=Caenorhabditis remanei TaxID=31234 RepID=A0A6A5GS95_CAERE|nr:hypothetical protein GCK72_014515 [Caenorhabditis remanei]KAF1758057.1 hypothetical protein GCK72_014515 [Caenorhabditis remanei]